VYVNGDLERPLGAGAERRAFKNQLAEQIATSADRLERQAAEIRATDKQLALQLLKEGMRLRRVARGIEIQHKRAQRARLSRQGIPNPNANPNKSKTWLAFLADQQRSDTASLG
jgi:hypothetical protein